MQKAIDIADALVALSERAEAPITYRKLCNLLYVASAIYAAKNGEKLFSDDILIGKFGPYVKSVSQKYYIYGAAHIYDVRMPILDKKIMRILNRIEKRYRFSTAYSIKKIIYDAKRPTSEIVTQMDLADLGENLKLNKRDRLFELIVGCDGAYDTQI